jgi:hypothetical protein
MVVRYDQQPEQVPVEPRTGESEVPLLQQLRSTAPHGLKAFIDVTL